MTAARRTEAVQRYFAAVAATRASGGATAERSYYPALENLLNAVGETHDPKVRCVTELKDMGAGHPDMGLYSARQLRRDEERPLPERGVVEVKAPSEDAKETAAGEQVRRYRGLYGLILVTNLREFLLQEEGEDGERRTLESFTLAASEEEFFALVNRRGPQTRTVRAGLGEFLYRALSHNAAIVQPRFLAAQLASYARDALERVEAAGDAPQLANIRAALEATLGVRFEGDDGDHFFRSTLVQTLFYGVFSAWVLWARGRLTTAGEFRWHDTVWNLNVPVLQELFQQMASPGQLKPLGLVEVLDWTAAALDRVERTAFFQQFSEGEAVPYFYEPFLEAFDPELRKQLGVWYTPPEVVRYMVARVDRALKDDLGIAEGLAAENVYVLDPCCGTGAYLAEVLRRINANLGNAGALRGDYLRKAATERVFGFEIMSAPYVIAHMQVGLTLRELDAALPERGDARPAIYLTNALTGWEPRTTKPLPFSEMEKERDHADEVKQNTPVLVILGNPPYNGFAGMAVDEERELSEAYRTVRHVRKPEGHGLNDLYVRFFRMAERRIAEKTGRGVVCFISNYSWLDGLSHTGMRERYLEAFDAIRIDCLNGDRYKTGKTAPDGSTDPSIFSTREDPVGIQVGTAIATLVRKADHEPAEAVAFRHLWGATKPAELTATAEAAPDALYEQSGRCSGWACRSHQRRRARAGPTGPRCRTCSRSRSPASRPAAMHSWSILIATGLRRASRPTSTRTPAMKTLAHSYPHVMKASARFDARAGAERAASPRRTSCGPASSATPTDPSTTDGSTGKGKRNSLTRSEPTTSQHVFEGNLWLGANKREIHDVFSHGTSTLAPRQLEARKLERIHFFPLWLRVRSERGRHPPTCGRANLTRIAEQYLRDTRAEC